jgi:hypothetical protein
MRLEIPSSASEMLRAYETPAVSAAASEIPAHRRWPDRLADEAFYGLAGDIVKAIEPHTESDPVALLLQILTGFGSSIGRKAHFRAEADRHYLNLFVVLVGATAKGRKGTSWGIIEDLLGKADSGWRDGCITSGLSSGEGLIWAVRDAIEEQSPIRGEGKRVIGHEMVRTDPGVEDKRLLVQEPEFARVLRVCERESNTLSAIIRQAWDSGKLNTLTRSKRATATGAHISVIGHITENELRKELSDTAAANGFANRFLFGCVRRSQELPEGGGWHAVDPSPFVERLKAAGGFARQMGELRRDEAAREIWHAVYSDLSAGRLGLSGAVAGRAEAQTMRLATLYAVLDQSSSIRAEHLTAALAVWRYCEESVQYIFGDSLGDATADEILGLLRARPDGVTRTDIREHFKRHKSADEIERALTVLESSGRARREREEETGGRPAERWRTLRGTAR